MSIAFSWPRKEWFVLISVFAMGAGACAFFTPKKITRCVLRPCNVYRATHTPKAAWQYFSLGCEKYHQKAYSEALKDFGIAHRLAPQRQMYARALAETQIRVDDFEGAIKSFTEVIELGGGNYSTYNSRGYAYLKLGNSEAAFKDFDRVVKLFPHKAIGYENRGWTYFLMANFKLAKSDMDKGLSLNPNSPTAYLDRANLKRTLGDTKGAEADFRKVLSSPDSGFSRNFVARGYAQLALGNKTKAKKEFEHALELNKYDKEAKALLAETLK